MPKVTPKEVALAIVTVNSLAGQTCSSEAPETQASALLKGCFIEFVNAAVALVWPV